MPTLLTDPRSGGVKKSSGVSVLPPVAECEYQVRDWTDPIIFVLVAHLSLCCYNYPGWSEVRDDSNEIDWLIIGYDGSSKTDVTVLEKGSGGLEECSANLPSQSAVFGGVRLSSGRFVTFFYASEGTSVMQKGRASMHKNGVFNVLEGSDGEIEIEPDRIEADLILPRNGGSKEGNKFPPKVYETELSAEAQGNTLHRVDHKPISEENVRYNENLHDKPSPALQQIKTSSEESEKVRKINDDTDKLKSVQDSGAVPYSLLKGITDISLLPEGVDPLKREMSLSEQEFQGIFGTDKESFSKLPMWKKTNQKKKALLF